MRLETFLYRAMLRYPFPIMSRVSHWIRETLTYTKRPLGWERPRQCRRPPSRLMKRHRSWAHHISKLCWDHMSERVASVDAHGTSPPCERPHVTALYGMEVLHIQGRQCAPPSESGWISWHHEFILGRVPVCVIWHLVVRCSVSIFCCSLVARGHGCPLGECGQGIWIAG